MVFPPPRAELKVAKDDFRVCGDVRLFVVRRLFVHIVLLFFTSTRNAAMLHPDGSLNSTIDALNPP